MNPLALEDDKCEPSTKSSSFLHPGSEGFNFHNSPGNAWPPVTAACNARVIFTNVNTNITLINLNPSAVQSQKCEPFTRGGTARVIFTNIITNIVMLKNLNPSAILSQKREPSLQVDRHTPWLMTSTSSQKCLFCRSDCWCRANGATHVGVLASPKS